MEMKTAADGSDITKWPVDNMPVIGRHRYSSVYLTVIVYDFSLIFPF